MAPYPEDRGITYPAHMQDVYFPNAQASAAKTVCERIATLLGDHLGARPAMVSNAHDGWEGAYRDEFDETWSIQETRLVGLKEDLQTLAGRLGTAMENVETINSQRATEREQYAAEQSEPAGAN
jgi:hypothetical protein